MKGGRESNIVPFSAIAKRREVHICFSFAKLTSFWGDLYTPLKLFVHCQMNTIRFFMGRGLNFVDDSSVK